MRRTIVGPDGTLSLGDQAERLGFVAGAAVEIIVTSAGSLLVCLDRSPPALDVAFTPLVGGAAQLAARRSTSGPMKNPLNSRRMGPLQGEVPPCRPGAERNSG